jgi:hypothetical protein
MRFEVRLGRDAHRVRQPIAAFGLVVLEILAHLRVAPDQMGGMAHRFGVFGQVVVQDANQLEPVAQLEGQHRVADLFLLHPLDIVLGRGHVAPAALRQARQTPAKDDALEPQVLAQLLALVVQALTDPEIAVLRIDEHLHAVEPMALRGMPRPEAVTGDLFPAVGAQRQALIRDERRAVADDLALILSDELPIRKIDHLPTNHRGGVTVAAAVDLRRQLCHFARVAGPRVPDDQGGALFLLCRHRGIGAERGGKRPGIVANRTRSWAGGHPSTPPIH